MSLQKFEVYRDDLLKNSIMQTRYNIEVVEGYNFATAGFYLTTIKEKKIGQVKCQVGHGSKT